MSSLQRALADYLAMRRALGYKLDAAEKLLGQFVDLPRRARRARRSDRGRAGLGDAAGRDRDWQATPALGVARLRRATCTADRPGHEVPPPAICCRRGRVARPLPLQPEPDSPR